MAFPSKFKILGIFCALSFMSAGVLLAQINKAIQSTTKSVTAPLKETQKATQQAVQPVKEVRTTTKAVTDAPKAVTREVQATQKSFENAGKEVERAKTDVEKAAGIDGSKSAKSDSSQKANTENKTNSGPVIIDERGTRDAVRDGGGYGDLKSNGGVVNPANGGASGGSNAKSGSAAAASEGTVNEGIPAAEINYNYRTVLLPPGKGKTNLKSVSRSSVAATSSKSTKTSTNQPPAVKAKPDYSASPAREALESADFQMETLADLFQFAEWEGPNREHTMRSIDYTLKQLKKDIDEIRYKDANHNIWNYEKQYREWRDAFVQQGGQ
jgi:hypothetical protein